MKSGQRNLLITTAVWIGLVVVAALTWKFLFAPKEQAITMEATGSQPRFQSSVRCRLDGFSGYALLRSPELKKALAQKGIQWVVQDDGADYAGRMQAFEADTCELAVFTVDAFLKTGAELGRFPGSMVMVLDESNGADGMVSVDPSIEKVDDLNRPGLRFVQTSDSPSEFLTRTLLSSFHLPLLEEKPFEARAGAEQVLKELQGDKVKNRVFVLWEPFLSKALEHPKAKSILDSSKMRGQIVDVLVASRSFIKDHGPLLDTVIREVMGLRYEVRRAGKWNSTIERDAKQLGTKLSGQQVKNVVGSILWKNTMDNYLHFGIETGDASEHIEEILWRVWRTLVKTKAWGAGTKEDPPVAFHHLYYRPLWEGLKAAQYHPLMAGQGLDAAQAVSQLPTLSENEWLKLKKVGEISMDPIRFGRGSSRLTVHGERSIAKLEKLLEAWPHFYLEVQGNTREAGDEDANRRLALDRAQAVIDHLKGLGCPPQRIKVSTAQIQGGEGQSVSFSFFEPPY